MSGFFIVVMMLGIFGCVVAGCFTLCFLESLYVSLDFEFALMFWMGLFNCFVVSLYRFVVFIARLLVGY